MSRLGLPCEFASCAQVLSSEVISSDLARLKSTVEDRNSPQKHVWRARIVLLTADGAGTNEIERRARVAKTPVWHWPEHYMHQGVDGLLRDKTLPFRVPPLAAEVAEGVVALTLRPPGETTHWTAAAMAAASGISISLVQRIWRAHGLQPHRLRQFELSRNPQLAAKLHDVVGLYVDPPAHAMVPSVHERSKV